MLALSHEALALRVVHDVASSLEQEVRVKLGTSAAGALMRLWREKGGWDERMDERRRAIAGCALVGDYLRALTSGSGCGASAAGLDDVWTSGPS